MEQNTYYNNELKSLSGGVFKKFVLNDMDNYTIFYNREHLYSFVKAYVIETNDFYIFTLKILFTKISLYMKSISDIVDILMEYYISYI
jgi:hypothetical protein